MIEVAGEFRGTMSSKEIVRAGIRIYRLLGVKNSERKLSIALVGEAVSRELNIQYRKKNHPANVLSFVYGVSKALREGEIVLCLVVIKKEARESAIPFRSYFLRLLVHGMLHVEGYKHSTARLAKKMEAQECRILTKIGINPEVFF